MKKLLYALMLGAMLYFGIQEALEMGDSRKWPITEGVVTKSWINQSPRSSTGNAWSSSGFEYEVKVQYSYNVDGASYTGNRLRIRPNKYSSQKSAQRELAEYQAGQRVQVYYNPKEPERSLLKHI